MTSIPEVSEKSTIKAAWVDLSLQLDQAEAELEHHKEQFKYHAQQAEIHRRGYEAALQELRRAQKFIPDTVGGRN